eukprot:14757378-Alexandrium_andersonii.AAC.1
MTQRQPLDARLMTQCETCELASNVRTWSCAGPKAASNWVPEARDRCIERHCASRFRICHGSW